MAAPIVVDVSWAKGKCDRYVLSREGNFYGIMNKPGQALVVNTGGDDIIDDNFHFLPCKNASSGKYTLCAASRNKLSIIPPDSIFECKLILLLGVTSVPRQNACPLAPRVLTYHYIEWEGVSPLMTVVDALLEYRNSFEFIRKTFGDMLKRSDCSELFIRPLNQISGFQLGMWNKLSYATRNAVTFHQMSSSPDVWSNAWLGVKGEKSIPRITGPSAVDNIPSVYYDKLKAAEVDRLLQFKDGETMIIYTRRQNRATDLSEFFLMPFPQSFCDEGYRAFAPLLPYQKKAIEDKFFSEGAGYTMDKDEFIDELCDCVENNGSSIQNYLILRYGMEFMNHTCVNFIVSYVNDDIDPSTFHGTTQVNYNTWVSFSGKNKVDTDVEGVAANRFFHYPKKDNLSNEQLDLLRQTYHSNGQKRHSILHSGMFVMPSSKRQTDTSSSSLCQVSSATNHQYSNESQMNTSLLSTSYPITTKLAKVTCSVQETIGQVVMSTIKKAFKWKDGCDYDSSVICPYGILTLPYFEKKRGYFSSFSNTEHRDHDFLDTEMSNDVFDYIERNGREQLKQYFNEMTNVFPESKKKVPLPTTCCWKQIEQLKSSAGIRHHQFFCITEGNVAWDLSSNAFVDNTTLLAGTFFGSLTSHFTSCSHWETMADSSVSPLCPGHFALAAWGSSGGYAYIRHERNQNRARRDQALHSTLLNRITNGQPLTRLPRVNIRDHVVHNRRGQVVVRVGQLRTTTNVTEMIV